MRLVLDTNVLISAIVFGGTPRRILDDCVAGVHRLLLSPPLLEELVDVLGRRKFALPAARLEEIRSEIVEISDFVEPRRRLSVIRRDPDDNRVLECALEGKADAIVSGDEDLCVLRTFRGIPIFTPARFLETK